MPDSNSGFLWGNALSGLGGLAGAAGSLLGGSSSSAGYAATAAGDRAEAQGLEEAAQSEELNKTLAGASGQIQDAMAARTIYKSTSGIEAAAAGAGFNGGGSAGDILRESAQQGALTRQMLGVQTEVNENTYQMQANTYTAEAQQAEDNADAADAAASAAETGGVLGAIGGVLGAAAKFAPMLAAL
jgi:hypothetical protein